MNLEQAVALTNMRKQTKVLLLEGESTKTAGEIAEMVFDLSAAAGEPYRDAKPEVWAERWLGSDSFTLVEIDPRQIAVPFVNRISRAKVLATMQASSDSLPPIVVDINKQGIGKSSSDYIPQVVVLDGKHRHRAQVLNGRERISAWVGEKALAILQARAASKNKTEIKGNGNGRPMSKIEVAAAWGGMSTHTPSVPRGGSVARQDTGDGGARPTGNTHAPTRTLRSTGGGSGAGAGASSGGASAGGGPGGAVSGLNPLRKGFAAGNDPSDRGQLLDPSDKDQFSHGAPKGGDPSKQSPGSQVGPRTRPSGGASNSEMSKKLLAGPVRVKKIVTDKKKRMQAVAPPGMEHMVKGLKKKFGAKSSSPFAIAWSKYNEKGKS